MKNIFYLFIIFPFLFSCGDDSSDKKNRSLEVDNDLLCECLQYKTDMFNWVLEGSISNAMINEIEFEKNHAELDKKCEDFERKIEKRFSDAKKKGEASLNRLINVFQQRKESCDAYNDFLDAENRGKKRAIERHQSLKEEFSDTSQSDTNRDIFDNITTSNRNGRIHLLDSSKTFIDQVLHNHFKKTLLINENEKYSYEIYKEHLNGDSIIDAVITLNRLEYAKQKAEESGNPTKAEKIGFMGPFNAFFLFDGKSNTLSSPLVVPSSPLEPLKVSFENITSIDFKDILIDFRIRNSSFKEVYFIINKFPKLVFEWTNFDGLGTPNEEAYVFDFKAGTNVIKDIIIYEGKIDNLPPNTNPLTYEPKIINQNKKIKTFFYSKSKGKYFTSKTP